MTLLLTTNNTFICDDLYDSSNNSYEFVHPLIDFDLTILFTDDEIRSSLSLQTAIDNNSITLNAFGVPLLRNAEWRMGSIETPPKLIDSSYTLDVNDSVIIYDGTNASDTLTLPLINDIKDGALFVVKNYALTQLTISPNASDTIDLRASDVYLTGGGEFTLTFTAIKELNTWMIA